MSNTPAEDRQRSSDADGGSGDHETRADRVMHPDDHTDRTDTGRTDSSDGDRTVADQRRTDADEIPGGYDSGPSDVRPADDRDATTTTAAAGSTSGSAVRDGDRDVTDRDVTDRDANDRDVTDRDTTDDRRSAAPVAAGAGAGAAAAGSRADEDPDRTQAMPRYEDDAPTTTQPAVDDDDANRRVSRDELYRRRPEEADRVAAVRADHAAASTPAEAEPTPVAAAADTDTTTKRRKVKPPRTTDKFLGSFGLFVLRIVTGVIMGVHGAQKLFAMEGTVQFFSQLSFFGYPLPQPQILALATGAAEVLIGIALVFGFLTRLCGFGVLLISVGALLMVKMTTLPNPFAISDPGFQGELELMLAAVGLLLLVVGGGGWAIDRLFRRGRYGNPDEQLG